MKLIIKKIKDISDHVFAQILVASVTFLSDLVFARFLLIEDYGKLSLFVVFISIGVIFSKFGISETLLKHVPKLVKENKLNNNNIVNSNYTIVLLSGLITTIILTGIFVLFYRIKDTSLLLLITLTAISILECNRSMFQVFKKTFSALLPHKTLPLLVTIIIAYLLVHNKKIGLPTLVFIYSSAFVFSAIISSYYLTKISGLQFKLVNPFSVPRKIFFENIYFAGITMSQLLYQRMDIIMISFFLPLSFVGYYNPIFKICIVLIIFQRAISFYFVPRISSLLKHREKLQREVALNTFVNCIFFILSGLLIIAFGGEILKIFGEDFIVAKNALLIIVCGELISSVFGGGLTMYLLMMADNHEKAMNIILVTLIFNILLNLYFIPKFGIEGAALATMISTVLKSVLLYLVTKKSLRVSTYAFVEPLKIIKSRIKL